MQQRQAKQTHDDHSGGAPAAAGRVVIGLFGATSLTVDGRNVDVGGPRQQAVLAVLAMHGTQGLPIDALIEKIWGEEPPKSARATLQAYVSRLRRAIGERGSEVLPSSRVGYEIYADEVDIERFETLVHQGRRVGESGDAAAAAALLATALKIADAEPLAGLSDYQFAVAERTRVDRLRVQAAQHRAEAELAVGNHESLAGELEQLVDKYPFHEPFWRQLMIARYRCGSQAAALRAYDDARAILVDELGLEPGPDLVATQAAVLRQDAGLATPVSRSTESILGEDVLVGRTDTIARLREVTQDIDLAGCVATVSGPAGIGKTTVLAAATNNARQAGLPVFTSQGWSESAPAFWPWIEILRQWLAEFGAPTVCEAASHRLEHLGRLLPELAAQSGAVAHAGAAPHEHLALYDAITSVLSATSCDRPFVIVFDDVQWADASSLELLAYLAEHVSSCRVALFLGRRTPEPSAIGGEHALARLEAVSLDFELGPLEPADTERLVRRSTLGLANLDSATCERIVDRSGGVPFYVVELARTLDAAGGAAGVSRSLRGSIMQRLGRLTPPTARFLGVASVAGTEFDPETVGVAAELDDDATVAAIDEASQAGIIVLSPARPGWHRFDHALVSEAIRDSLSRSEAQAHHRHLAAALASRAGRGDEDAILERAHHALEAAVPSEPNGDAIEWAEAAAELAIDRCAPEVAIEWLDRAAPIARASGDEVRWCEVLLRRGEIENRLGRVDAAKATHLEAASAARALGSGRHLARAAVGYSFTRMDVQTLDHDHIRLCAEAEATLDAAPSVERAALLASWGTALYWDDAHRGAALVDASVEMARQLEDPSVLATTLQALAWFAYGDGAKRLEIGSEMLTLAHRARDIDLELWARRWIHVGFFDSEGPTDRCRVSLKHYADLAETAALPHHRWFVALHQANLALLEGRISEAEHLIDAGYEVGQTAEPITAAYYYGAQMFNLRWLQGRIHELIPLAEMTVAQHPEVHTWRALLAYLYAATDDPVKARQRLLELEAIGWGEIMSGGTTIMAHGLAAEAAVRCGSDDLAASLLPHIESHGDHYVHMAFVTTMGSAHFFRSRLLAAVGDIDAAIEAVEMATRDDLARRLSPLLVRDWSVHAELLEKRGHPGDGAKAEELRVLAEREVDELGMAGLGYL